jgi:glycogen debranching enzyme
MRNLLHISHQIKNQRTDEFTKKEKAAFLITNKRGNYLSLGQNNFSHTQGLFFFDKDKWDFFKTIESISIDKEMTGITNKFSSVKRDYKGETRESFNLFNNSMVYLLEKYQGKVKIDFDFRYQFDFDEKGRIYSVEKENDSIIITYKKYSDDSLRELQKTVYLAIKGANEYKILNEWIKKNYSYDKRRNSKNEFYVFRGLEINCKKTLHLTFSFSHDRQEAINHASNLHEHKEYFSQSLRNYIDHTFTSDSIELNVALKALDDLTTSVESKGRSAGIMAGLPWFGQLWSRDELISLKAWMLSEKYDLVKKIIFKYLTSVSKEGLVPNRLPDSQIKSMDATGWLFLRTKEFIEYLVSKKKLSSHISSTELSQIKETLEKAIIGLSHFHSKEGLIISNLQETWMDTMPAKRDGACIELQAMFLSMIKLHNLICKITKEELTYKEYEKEFKEKVRENFYKDGKIKDTLQSQMPDNIVRPNLFLAYYIEPELFKKNQWKKAFDNSLRHLWLGWGGLSTIDHFHPLFKMDYSGESDESYHNGDSWYFVNNLAAIAMRRLSKIAYHQRTKRIFDSSTRDLLFSGFIGCSSEVSSSRKQESEGCLSQAWSVATYIELWHELNKKTFF